MDFDPNSPETTRYTAVDEPLDPDFSVDYTPDIDPDFSVSPPYFPIMPDTGTSYPPVISFFPKPVIPCLYCNAIPNAAASVRFLNASVGYNAFSIYVNNQLLTNDLNDGEITQYSQFTPGYITITVMGNNGYIYIQKSMSAVAGMTTFAIVNTASGLDLVSITDSPCTTPNFTACFRVCNLAFYTGPVNVVMNNLTFTNVKFAEPASFSKVRPGSYPVSVYQSRRPELALVTTYVNLNVNRIYTLYVLNWNTSADTVRTLLVEDRG
ncbi:DUF4397 domain-containing protein [Clostridium sp. chh4-2]|uniref:DUF4397 domain-containing protein n=1 Tax=Clostridium sp. chh4-2 TaxID=2067550 RepID=UPI001FA84A73|nr:DUF4397 domain-containing protein [Clostridium sp. chh4-2]